MRAMAIVVALVACCGCQDGESKAPAEASAVVPITALVDRVWARSDSTGLPGVMRIFLEDGTLVMDSCWETYQLVKWRVVSDSVVAWQEGPDEVRATVLELDSDDLVLRLDLVGGSHEERYRTAAVPFLCPDMPR